MPSLAAQYSLMLSLVGRAPVFLCGVAAAWLWVWYGNRLREEAARAAWLRRGGADATLLGLLFVLGLLLVRAEQLGFFIAEAKWPAWHVYEGLLWAGVVLAVMLLPLRCRPLLARGPLVWLGTISYSVYIWHYPILHGLLRPLWTESGGPGWTLRGSGFALLGFAATAAVSTLSYRFVERPFLVRKARIEG
jgi:peptidoglycan/LPS O-acetylase OafA/YrhL